MDTTPINNNRKNLVHYQSIRIHQLLFYKLVFTLLVFKMSDEMNTLLSRLKEVRIEQDKSRIKEDKIIVDIEQYLSVDNVTDITTTPTNNNTPSGISPTTSPTGSQITNQ